MFRAFSGRKRVVFIRRNMASRLIQRVFRGHIGRQIAKRERDRLETLRRRAFAATKIQASWHMMVRCSRRFHTQSAVQ